MRGLEEPLLDRLVALLGDEATLALVVWRGGQRLYIPGTSGRAQASQVESQLGEAATRALAAEFGGTYLSVPLAKRWRARIYRARGDSYAAIARLLGCSESAVWRHLQGADEEVAPLIRDPRQRAFPF